MFMYKDIPKCISGQHNEMLGSKVSFEIDTFNFDSYADPKQRFQQYSILGLPLEDSYKNHEKWYIYITIDGIQ